MKKLLGTAIFVTFAVSIWTASPVVAIGMNVLLRPDYQMRDFSSEYVARFFPNRARWYEFRAYGMDCAQEGRQRAVILHTSEFSETPSDFLSRAFPQCTNVSELKDKVPGIFHGIGIGRI